MTAPKVAAIILAAGGSSRLGKPKQLLDWFGKPFVIQLIEVAHNANLDPVVVVTGSGFELIEQAITNKNVMIARNVSWQVGQSSSMQKGVQALSKSDIDSFIIFLCDQPHVPNELIKKMIHRSKEEDIDIVATSVSGKLCPPTLFKKRCIEGIDTLEGDQGGRRLFNSYNTEILTWEDERLLQDTDTEEDYQRLISLYQI